MEGLFATLTNVDFDDAALADLPRARPCRARFRCSVGAGGGCARLRSGHAVERTRGRASLKSLVLFGLRGLAAYAYHYSGAGLSATTRCRPSCMKAWPRWPTTRPDAPTCCCRCRSKVGGGEPALYGVARSGEHQDVRHAGAHHGDARGGSRPLHRGLWSRPARPQAAARSDGRPRRERLHARRAASRARVSRVGSAMPTSRAMWEPHGRASASSSLDLPAPVLFTTNCLMPPAASYADRVFTTGPVAYPGMMHVEAAPDGGKTSSRSSSVRWSWAVMRLQPIRPARSLRASATAPSSAWPTPWSTR